MKPKTSDVCPVCSSKTLEDIDGNELAEISWIRCDICRQWYHSVCLVLTATRLGQISSFHCPECEPEHGPSHLKRQSKRARNKIDYVALDQGETFAVDKSVHPHVPNFLNFSPSVDHSCASSTHIDVLDSRELTAEFVHGSALERPVVVHNVTPDSGLQLPESRENITVGYITDQAGASAQVEVMDVLSQQSEQPAWSLGRWREYFYTPESERDRIRNVISLEVSQVPGLGTNFKRPKMVTDLDLVDKVWCDTDGLGQARPQVTVYCLMSVRGSYTDFHIDFSGTPVYYTVCHGSKTFLMYPPSPENLALYESWCLEPHQNFTWFADYTKRIGGKKIKPSQGFKVSLQKGDLFIIPSGWIHSVYTPDDAVIIGGNYLTLRDLPMHLKIYELERRTRVPSKYRFPVFNKVLWLTSWYYFNRREEFLYDLGVSVASENVKLESAPQPESSCSQSSITKHESIKHENTNQSPNESEVEKPKSEPSVCLKHPAIDLNGKDGHTPSSKRSALASDETTRPKAILRSLIDHLSQHYEMSKTSPPAKKSIPTRLIGRNVKGYLADLEIWLQSL